MKRCFAALLLVFAAGVLSAGDKIIAAWDFSQKEPLTSGSTKLELRGKSVIEDGMLIVSNPDMSKQSGAVVRDKKFRELSPKSAFSLSVTFMIGSRWVRPAGQSACLFDTKYGTTDPKGFMFFLTTSDGKIFYPRASFGFGDKSAMVTGKRVTLKPDVLHTAELIFSATGKVAFMMDGKSCGGGKVPSGSVEPSRYSPVIGDRQGSNYCPLGGGIRKVVLKELPYEPVVIERDLKTRTVFERGEKGKKHRFTLTNLSQKSVENVTVNVFLGKQKLSSVKTGTVPAGKQFVLELPADTLLIPGTYTLNLEAVDGTGKKMTSAASEFTVVPAFGDFMQVVMTGTGDPKVLADIGFTHQCMGIFPAHGDFKEGSIPATIRKMDDNLKNGLYVYCPFVLKYRFEKPGRCLRKDRNGKLYARPNVEASNPVVRSETAAVVEATAKALGDHPAWDSVVPNSEQRDSSEPSFTGVEEAAFKKYAGYNIPADVTSKYPREIDSYPEYPWDHVLPDNDRRLAYYSWFWRTGDGWNDLNTLITETLHKHIKHHFYTISEPVVRVPSQWGSGGKTDAIGQWTYTNPDPVKIGHAIDEMHAMTQGQKVISETQIIWYRNQTAPIGQKVANTPAWVAKQPKAIYITIAPDCLREALWCNVSRRIDGLMYHGIASLLPDMTHGAYRFTNGESKVVLKEILHRVVKPLGPALKAIPERETEVAILEGFASTLFARQHAAYGWSNKWSADLHLALQWAHFQPTVLYEEHLLNNLQSKNLKVLFLPGYEVTTEKVAAKLRELQDSGVILVGDEFTCPGVSLDFRIKSVQRKKADPAGSKAALQKLGKEIAAMLEPCYRSPFSASSQDIVLRRRGSDAADYVFLVNDKRTFGDYLGPWGLVMEKGLPVDGTVTVNHSSGAAYDVVNHKPVPFRNVKGQTVFDASLAAGDGALILLTAKPVAGIDMTLPSAPVAKGEAYGITFRVKDTSGDTVKSVMPLEIVLTSSDGVRLPGSGYYAAKDGVFTLQEFAATNMTQGEVKVLVRDLASGKTAEGEFTVK